MIDQRLITFLTVAEIGSFTRASEVLNLTQPAVSQHIKFIEEYYGINLFKKQGRDLILTEEGKLLFKYSKDIERLHREVENKLKNSGTIIKNYKIGATMTIGAYVLPHILAQYKKEHKNIDIILQVNNTEEIIEKLINRKIDLALVEGPFNKDRFNYIKFKEDELVLAVSPDHEFCKRDEVNIDDIIEGQLILREKGSGTRKIFENKLTDLGFDIKKIRVYMEVGDISAIKSLVEANLGYTIISKESIKKEIEAGTICQIPINNVRVFREFNFIYFNSGEEEFIDNFIEFCENCKGGK